MSRYTHRRTGHRGSTRPPSPRSWRQPFRRLPPSGPTFFRPREKAWGRSWDASRGRSATRAFRTAGAPNSTPRRLGGADFTKNDPSGGRLRPAGVFDFVRVARVLAALAVGM